MKRRGFLSGLLSVPLFRRLLSLPLFGSIFRPILGEKALSKQITDREETGLRGLVKTCVEETISPRRNSLKTTEYDLAGRLLTTRTSYANGLEWVTTKTYDAGRLVKTFSTIGGGATEVLYEYDEGGRLKEIRDGNGNQISYRYDQQGRKTEIRRFATETVGAREFWLPPDVRQGVPTGGSVTTLFDERDLPTELQILDSQDRVIRRFVRTYDANGRIVEENQIQENPALWYLDQMPAEQRSRIDDKQLEEMNKGMKAMFSGKNGTGKSFTYDPQGRVTEMRDRNFGSDTVTATSYNEQGDKSEERMTTSSNLADMVIAGLREGMPPTYELPLDLERTWLTISKYRYEYDQNGNWTERTTVSRQVVDSSESGERSTVDHRTLTYF